jgi:hypothetical protein
LTSPLLEVRDSGALNFLDTDPNCMPQARNRPTFLTLIREHARVAPIRHVPCSTTNIEAKKRRICPDRGQ